MTFPRVELVYFTGCPHVNAARNALRSALEAEGLEVRWREWNRDDPHTPESLRRYGSPTVLVDGRDVVDAPDGGSCCRVYAHGNRLVGAPDAGTIRAVLAATRVAQGGDP